MTQPLVSSSAEVRAHDRIVRYRRSGKAGPALLLLAADHSTDLWQELPRVLAERFRLVIPDLPASPPDVAPALRCLLDGLGSVGVPIIAAGRYCDAALELALERNEAVGRVVLIPEPSLDDGWGQPPASSPDGASPAIPIPVHVLPRALAADEAMDRILAYLAS